MRAVPPNRKRSHLLGSLFVVGIVAVRLPAAPGGLPERGLQRLAHVLLLLAEGAVPARRPATPFHLEWHTRLLSIVNFKSGYIS